MNSLDVADLLIVDGDLVLDESGEPVLTHGLDAVGQDLKHKIIESNLLYELIAERSRDVRQQTFKRIKRLIETDRRIEAGTVSLKEPKLGEVRIYANAINGQAVEII